MLLPKLWTLSIDVCEGSFRASKAQVIFIIDCLSRWNEVMMHQTTNIEKKISGNFLVLMYTHLKLRSNRYCVAFIIIS